MILKRIKTKLKKIIYISRGVFDYNFWSFFVPLVPRKMMINLTYNCNSRCVMCNIWKRKKTWEMSLKDWKKVVGDRIFRKIEVLTLSGGEAMLHKEFLNIVELFIKRLPKLREIIVISNGLANDYTIKTLELFIRQCVKGNIKPFVVVSLDGIGEMHDFTRGIKGAAERSKKTLLGLKELKKKYDFYFVGASLILRQNLDRIEEVENWFEKNGINRSFQVVGFHDTFIKNMDTKKNVDFERETKKKLLSILNHLTKKDGKENKQWFRSYFWKDLYEMYANNRNRTTPCPFLKDQLVIDCLGDVYYCLSERRIGNFLEEKRSILEIYNDKKNIEFRKKMVNGVCLKCNSACDINEALAKDLKKILWFKMTGKLLGNRP